MVSHACMSCEKQRRAVRCVPFPPLRIPFSEDNDCSIADVTTTKRGNMRTLEKVIWQGSWGVPSRNGKSGERIHKQTGIERKAFALEENAVVGRTRSGSLRRRCRSLNEDTRPQALVVCRLQFPIFRLAEAVVVQVVVVISTGFANDRERVVKRVASAAARGCPYGRRG